MVAALSPIVAVRAFQSIWKAFFASSISVPLLITANLWAHPAMARPWSDIVESRTLKVGVKDNVPPLAWRDDSGEWRGFEIDIARALAASLLGDAEAVELVPVRNGDRLQAVTDNRVDLAIAQLGITADRLRVVGFTVPYYLDGSALVVPTTTRLTSSAGLTNERIAVLAESSAVATLNANFPDLTVVGTESYQAGLAALQAGRVDGFVGDASVMAGWLLDRPDYQLMSPLLSGTGLAAALPKGNQYAELRRRVHVQMQAWADNNWFEQQAIEWNLP